MLRVTAILLSVLLSQAVNVDDPKSLAGSFNAYMKIREKLPLAVRNQLWITDDAESAILTRCAKKHNVPQALFTAYTTAREAERQIVKAEASAAGPEKAVEILDVYRAVRKETPWNFMKLREKFKPCFAKPSSGLQQYELMRKNETAKDRNIGKANTETETETPEQKHLKELEEELEEEDETNVEEGSRWARSEDVQEGEAVETGYDEPAVVVVVGPVHGTSKVVVETSGRPDDVTSDDVTSVDATNPDVIRGKNVVGDSGFLVKFAMIFGMIVHVVIAVLIVVSQRDRIAAWCGGQQSNEDLSSKRETEPLHTGKQIPAAGTTYSASKTGFNPL